MIHKLKEAFEHIPPEILKKKLNGILWEGTPDSCMLALTFDDGPDPDITPRVLDSLDEIGARATFFMLGEQVRKYPAVARMVLQRGHLIGNHSMTHSKMFLMSRKEAAREIEDTQTALSDAVGIEPKWFRPPYGIFDLTTADEVRNRGLAMVLWTVLSGDYSDDPPDRILRRLEPFIRPGAVMVFHDTAQGGGLDLQGILQEIHKKAGNGSLRYGGVDELRLPTSLENGE